MSGANHRFGAVNFLQVLSAESESDSGMHPMRNNPALALHS